MYSKKEKCFNAIKKNPNINSNELAEVAGCSVRFARECIQCIREGYDSIKKKYKERKINQKFSNEETSKEEKETHNKNNETNVDIKNNEYIHNKHYYYNKDSDAYVIFLTSATTSKPFIFPGETIRAIRKKYSNWDGAPSTINEVCRDLKIPRSSFVELKTKLFMTHDSEPFTIEEMLDRNEDELVEEALQQKRFNIYTKFKQKEWAEIQNDAQKWRDFETGILQPWNNVISDPIPYEPPNIITNIPKNEERNKALVIPLADSHFGAGYDSNQSMYNNNFDLDEAVYRLDLIGNKILEKTCNIPLKEIYIMELGDSLEAEPTHKTRGGTSRPLNNTPEEIWRTTINSHTDFMIKMMSLGADIKRYNVPGNHFPLGDYQIETYLEGRFGEYDNVEINPNDKKGFSVLVGDTQFVGHHGKKLSPVSNQFPTKKELSASVIVTSWFKRDYKKAKHTEVLVGHTHHKNLFECAQFNLWVCPSIMGADTYSDELVLHSKPGIMFFVVDYENGIEDVKFINF
jgi:hypothetical protein